MKQSPFRHSAKIMLAIVAGTLVSCEYSAGPMVAPNPVAYVRPAPSQPFAPGANADSKGLSPNVAVTIQPPGTPPVSPPTLLDMMKEALSVAMQLPMQPLPSSLAPPQPVATVPAYTAPVYSPGGARSGG